MANNIEEKDALTPETEQTAPVEDKAALREAKAREKREAKEAAAILKQAAKDKKAADKATAKEAKAARKAAAAEEAEPRRKARRRTVRVVLILVVLLAVLAVGGVLYGGYTVTNSPTNLANVYVDGIPVGGLTKEQTLAALTAQGWDKETATNLRLKLPGDINLKLNRLEAGAVISKEQATELAYAYGHGDNWVENLMLSFRSRVMPVDVAPDQMAFNEDYIRDVVEKGIETFEKNTVDKGYTVDRENQQLKLVKGAGELSLDADKICALVEEAFRSGQDLVEYGEYTGTPREPDFEAIYEDLAVEPQDAHFKEDSIEIEPEVIGCRFDMAEAKRLWQAAGALETVSVPLEILEPAMTAEELESLLFRDLLGEQTTYYHGSTAARGNNINLATSKINGTILMPGQTFSYNGTVGERTRAAGFQEAGAYVNGEVVDEVGGGICQVSSTLYCASMYAQMTTTARESHYFRVGYLPIGMDATVSWGGPDFQFTNNREYPVKIVSWCDTGDKSIHMQIWGTNLNGSYVTLSTSQWTIFDDEYTDVMVGWGALVTRNVYDGTGSFLYSVQEPTSIYNMHPEDIDWPVKPTDTEGSIVIDGSVSTPGSTETGGDDDGGSQAIIIVDD